MSEKLNQNQNQQSSEGNQDFSDSNGSIDFEKESEADMKALAKGLMVDLVWTLSGINKASTKEDKPKDSPQPN
jgi:hypothetical protein